MKVFLGILLTCTVFAGSVQSASAIAGAPCQASEGIYHSNPLACDSYLVCDHSKFIQRPCPAGLHWNRVALTCDWPSAAKCKLDPIADIPAEIPPTVYHPGDACDVGDLNNNVGLYQPHPADCSQYLTCLHGKYIARPCGSLHWNAKAQTCDRPENANCSIVAPPQLTTTTEKPPSPTVTPITRPGDACDVGNHTNNAGLYRPHPNDCSQYLTCLHGKYVAQSCGTLHWNSQARTCDRPENANCTTTIPAPAGKCPSTFERNQLVVIYPHPNCGWFYVCENGRPAERPCPNGLEWNESLTTCDWPEFAGCAEGSAPVQPDAVLWIRDDSGPRGFLKRELLN